MRKLIASLCVLFVCSNLSAQRLFLMSSDSSYLEASGLLSVGFNAEAASNALTNGFMKKMGFGGLVGVRTKDQIFGDLEDVNRIGMHAQTGMSYRRFEGGFGASQNWNWQAGVSHHTSVVGAFSRDAFQIAFGGNAAYQNQTAVFDQSSAQAVNYQKLSAGVFHKRNFSFVQLSAVNGMSYQSVHIDEASLYTSEFADTLLLNYQGSFTRSDTANLGFGGSNGRGFAIDAAYSVPFEDGGGYMVIGVEDLGQIWWSDETLTSSADSSFLWTGVDFGEITSETTFSFPTLEDSLYHTQNKGPKQTWLPARVYASVMRKVNGNDFWFATANIRPDGHQLPQFSGGYGYFANPQTLWTFSVQAGGYGRMAVGAGVEKKWGPVYLHLEIPDLPGLVMRDHHGLAARLRLGYFLNAHSS